MRVEVGGNGSGTTVGLNHFVLALVDGASPTIFFAVGHGVAHRNAAHELAYTRPLSSLMFGEDEVEVVGEEEEAVE